MQAAEPEHGRGTPKARVVARAGGCATAGGPMARATRAAASSDAAAACTSYKIVPKVAARVAARFAATPSGGAASDAEQRR